MPRLPVIKPEDMNEDQKATAKAITSGPRGEVRGPFIPLLHNAGVANQVQALGASLRFKGTLADNLRELAILISARHWTAQYEWFAHRPIAEKGGVSADICDAIAEGKEPPFDNDDEALVYRYCRELYAQDGHTSDETFAAAKEAFGAAGVVELTVLTGFYTTIAMVLNNFEMLPPDGSTPLPPL